jgi:hypothetical protein
VLVRPSIVVAVLLLVVLGIYANALEVPFLWDDRGLILNNPEVRHGVALSHGFSHPFWMNADEAVAYFRPFVTLSYQLDFLLHGENPAGFHLSNLALHVLNTGLLFALARRLGASTLGAALASAAFALMPRLTESVTWIAGRTDVFATTAVLTALLVWPAPIDRRKISPWVGALALLAGLLCKEVALAGVAAVITFELVHPSRSARRSATALVPVLIGVLAFFALRLHALGANASGDDLSGMGARLAAACASWGTYGWMLVVPWHPSLQVGLAEAASPMAIGSGLVVFAIAIAAFVRSALRGDSAVAAALVVPIVGLALVSHLVPLPTRVLCADRFLYLPVAGLALAAAVSAERLAPKRKAAAAVVCVGWILASGIFTFVRNAHMADELGLWIETAEGTDTANPLPAIELGNVLFRAGAFSDSLRIETAVLAKLDRDHKTGAPEWMHASSTAATCLSSLGDYGAARSVRKLVVDLRPTSWQAWLDLARVELHMLDFDASRAAIDRAEQISADAKNEGESLSALVTELDHQRHAQRLGDTTSLVEQARFEDRAGRRLQSEQSWLDVLRRPDVTPAVLGEGGAFLANRGSVRAATLALDRIQQEPQLSGEARDMRDAIEQRRRLAERIDAERSRIVAYEERFR